MLRIENEMKQSCSGGQCFVCSAVGYRSVVIFSLGSRAKRKAVQAPTVAAKGYEIDMKLAPSHCVYAMLCHLFVCWLTSVADT
jgi:hypothetical protein